MTVARPFLANLLPRAWVAAVLLAAVAWLMTAFDGSDESRVASARLKQRALIVRSFSDRVEDLSAKATDALDDTLLIHRSLTGDPLTLAEVLDEFSRRPLTEGQGIELVDARGSVLLWSGRTWVSASTNLRASASGQRQAVVDRVGAVVVLRVGIPARAGGFEIRVHEPLSVDALGLERVFGRPTLTARIEEIAGRSPRIIPAHEFSGSQDAIPLIAFDRDTLAYALVPGLTSAVHTVPTEPYPDLADTTLWIASLMLVMVWLFYGSARSRSWWWTCAGVVALWSGRLLFGVLGVPARLGLGAAVDPRVYAAPSIAGLTASPLDLLISSAVLAASTWIVSRRLMRSIELGGIKWPRWLSVAGLLFVSAALVYLTRGFVVAVRSIIYDSTVSLTAPAAIVPTLPEIILLSSLFFLAISFRTVWLLAVRGLGWLARSARARSTFVSWGWAFGCIAIAAAGFLFIDRSQIVTWWVFAWSALGAFVIVMSEDIFHVPRLVRWIPHGIAILMMTIPVLDLNVRAHALDETQRRVEERIRPRDSWFTFVLTSDLHALATDPETAEVLKSDHRFDPGLSAFRLWSRTLLSQQRLNTGMAIFDRDGRERDRFMAGLGTYEQQVILRAVFDGNEETVQTIDLQTGLETRAYHGAWSTIRGPDNEVFGTVALLSSEADDQDAILTTVSNSGNERTPFHMLEYAGDVVQRTTDPGVSTGTRLDPEVRRRLNQSSGNTVRVEEPERRAEVIYVRDPDDPGRVVAGVIEEMDVRWHVFYAVKVALFFAVWGLLGALLSRSWRHAAAGLAGGFRARLFAAFSLIALVPLILLAIYNQEISTERTDRNVEQSLARDVGLIQQRIETTILGEDDLTLGLTDDFCAAVASDLGVEFSVFRAEHLTASSLPELYASAVLESRMPAEAFGRVLLRGEPLVVVTERIGPVTYAVGYGPFFLDGRPAGIVAVPMLHRQAGIEEDLAERNAFLVVAAAGVFILVLLLGGWLSGMIAEPVRRLTEATERIRAGRPPVSLQTRRRDELGTLMNAFDLMAKELDESRRRVAQAEREQAWREMAKQVAHEIKNPLTPMKLSLQHLRQAFQDRAPERESLLSKVVASVLEQVDTLARIATEFSRFARLPERAFTRVDVMASIREAAALFGSVPGIRIQLTLAPEEAIIVGDSDELRRVFINLFRNSIQAMDDNGSVHVTADAAAGTLRIRIHDSGPGIPESLRGRVFEPSFSTKTDGMGLGLAIVRGVISDLGGSIELQPTSAGAEFLIVLPVHTHA